MQQIWLALIIGLILGWLIEWLIDWRYWRKHVAALRTENALLRRQLDELHAPKSAPFVPESSSPPAGPSPSAGASTLSSGATTAAAPAE